MATKTHEITSSSQAEKTFKAWAEDSCGNKEKCSWSGTPCTNCGKATVESYTDGTGGIRISPPTSSQSANGVSGSYTLTWSSNRVSTTHKITVTVNITAAAKCIFSDVSSSGIWSKGQSWTFTLVDNLTTFEIDETYSGNSFEVDTITSEGSTCRQTYYIDASVSGNTVSITMEAQDSSQCSIIGTAHGPYDSEPSDCISGHIHRVTVKIPSQTINGKPYTGSTTFSAGVCAFNYNSSIQHLQFWATNVKVGGPGVPRDLPTCA